MFYPVADISLNFVNTEITCMDISPLVSPLQKHLEYRNEMRLISDNLRCV